MHTKKQEQCIASYSVVKKLIISHSSSPESIHLPSLLYQFQKSHEKLQYSHTVLTYQVTAITSHHRLHINTTVVVVTDAAVQDAEDARRDEQERAHRSDQMRKDRAAVRLFA